MDSNLDPRLFGQGYPPEASNPQPANPQPTNPQPANPQPYSPQPYPPQPYPPQPYPPQPAFPLSYPSVETIQQATIPLFYPPVDSTQQATIPLSCPRWLNLQPATTLPYPPQVVNLQQATTLPYPPQVDNLQQATTLPYPPQVDNLQQATTLPYPPQVDNLQQAIPQAHPPEVDNLQPATPQAHHPEVNNPPLTIQQATIPSQTFEEEKAKFYPVPEPHPDPTPRSGPGRKKKNQRFWAPEGASPELQSRYGQLQTCDLRVNGAEKKLESNNDPSQTAHCQKMVIRDMKKRQEKWMECKRMEQGLPAVELGVEAAKSHVQEQHQLWILEHQKLRTRIEDLWTNYPSAVHDDYSVDNRRLPKKAREGLSSLRSWHNKRWASFVDSIPILREAFDREHEPGSGQAMLDGGLMHRLGCSPGWSLILFPSNSPESVAQRQNFADPNFYERLNGQLENGQSAEYPHANLGHGTEQTAGVYSQPAQDQQKPQMQQDHISKEASEGVDSYSYEENMAVIKDFNRAQPIDFGKEPQQPTEIPQEELPAPIAARNTEQVESPVKDVHVDEEMADTPTSTSTTTTCASSSTSSSATSWTSRTSPSRCTTPSMTQEEFDTEVDTFYQKEQPGQPQGQEGSLDKVVADMESQGLTMTDAQVADVFGTTGPNGEHQAPQGQEVNNNNEGSEASGDPMDEDEDEEAGIEWEDVILPRPRGT